MARVPHVFIEVNPFHAETLFTYFVNCSGGPDDLVFGHARLFSQPLFKEIQGEKRPVSIVGMLKAVVTQRVRVCHFNTINLTLTPLNPETIGLGLKVIVLSLAARLMGCRLSAIVHEADQFFATGLDSGRRAIWFRNAFGRWWIRLFAERYVLSPEVHRFLTSKGISVKLLDASPWTTFPAGPGASSPNGATVAWIGPVVGLRRSWTTLAELDPARLSVLGVTISMLCDGRSADAPSLRAQLESRGLTPYFRFLDYRPDDYELVREVRASLGILCLYGSHEYGVTKSSGARIIAFGLGKPFISNHPVLGVYRPDGSLVSECGSLTDCIERLRSARTSS
jgi:hypothetical protein